jgi:hypothetical protein
VYDIVELGMLAVLDGAAVDVGGDMDVLGEGTVLRLLLDVEAGDEMGVLFEVVEAAGVLLELTIGEGLLELVVEIITSTLLRLDELVELDVEGAVGACDDCASTTLDDVVGVGGVLEFVLGAASEEVDSKSRSDEDDVLSGTVVKLEIVVGASGVVVLLLLVVGGAGGVLEVLDVIGIGSGVLDVVDDDVGLSLEVLVVRSALDVLLVVGSGVFELVLLVDEVLVAEDILLVIELDVLVKLVVGTSAGEDVSEVDSLEILDDVI